MQETEYLGYAVDNIVDSSIYQKVALNGSLFHKQVLQVLHSDHGVLDPWAVIERYPCANVGTGTNKSLDVFLCAAFGKNFSIPNGRLEVRVATYNDSDSKVVVEEMLAWSKPHLSIKYPLGEEKEGYSKYVIGRILFDDA